MTTLGFLGLGQMGGAMARRLVDAGHDVVVWNRSPAAADELVAAGATRADSPAEALAADVSFTMLANDEVTEAVLSDEAIASAAGRIHVSMGSISPAASDRLAERFARVGASYVAAPVLGRPAVAAAGKLNVLAAAPAELIDAVEPYLSTMGQRVWRIGETPRMANVVKISVNYNIIHAIQALGESIAIVERQGVDPAAFVEVLTNTLFGGVVYTGYGNEIVTQDYEPGFHVALGLKDLKLAQEVAAEGGVRLGTAPALREAFERTVADDELGGSDWGAVAEVTRRDLL